MKLTKKAVTIQLLESGRNGNPGPMFTVDEIVERVNRVFPGGKGTNKDCVYYYSSKIGAGLSRSNKLVDKSAYDALQSELTGAPVPEASPKEEEPTETESTEEPGSKLDMFAEQMEALKVRLRAEIEADLKAQMAIANGAKPRVIKKRDRKQA